MAAKNVEYGPLSVEKSRQKPLYIFYDCEAANSQVTADIVEIAARCFSEITTTAFESLISTSQELGKFSEDIVSLFIMLIMLCFFVYYAYYVVFLCLLCLLCCVSLFIILIMLCFFVYYAYYYAYYCNLYMELMAC